jgi:LuxR family transcriptional regulator, glucitol operon activator
MPRVLTVVGEGAIGKTALSVKCLYDLIDDAECPYEAVLWSSLKTEMLRG